MNNKIKIQIIKYASELNRLHQPCLSDDLIRLAANGLSSGPVGQTPKEQNNQNAIFVLNNVIHELQNISLQISRYQRNQSTIQLQGRLQNLTRNIQGLIPTLQGNGQPSNAISPVVNNNQITLSPIDTGGVKLRSGNQVGYTDHVSALPGGKMDIHIPNSKLTT